MTVVIDEMSTEVTVDPPSRSGAGSRAAPAEEVRIEELRAIVRELVIEELERYLRTAVER